MPASTPKVVVSALVLVYAQTLVNLRYASQDSQRIYETVNRLQTQDSGLRYVLSLIALTVLLLLALAVILRYRDFLSVLLVYLYQSIFVESLVVLFILRGLSQAIVLIFVCYLPVSVALGWWKASNQRDRDNPNPTT